MAAFSGSSSAKNARQRVEPSLEFGRHLVADNEEEPHVAARHVDVSRDTGYTRRHVDDRKLPVFGHPRTLRLGDG